MTKIYLIKVIHITAISRSLAQRTGLPHTTYYTKIVRNRWEEWKGCVRNWGNQCSWTTVEQDCIFRGAAQSTWCLVSAPSHTTSPLLKESPWLLKKPGEMNFPRSAQIMLWPAIRARHPLTGSNRSLYGDAAQLVTSHRMTTGLCLHGIMWHRAHIQPLLNAIALLPGMVTWNPCTVVYLDPS